jgi:hypothetical protein
MTATIPHITPAIYTGKIGTATRAQIIAPEHQPALAMHLIEITDREAPTFWRYHAVGVISLARAGDKVKRVYPEAQYQLVVFSIDPDRIPPSPRNMTFWQKVNPHDIDLQFHGIDEPAAAEVARQIAIACVDGIVPVEVKGTDPTAEPLWRGLVRSVIDRLAEPMYGGRPA